MKINLDLKKGTEAVSGVLQKTNEISKRVSVSVQEKAKDFSEKSKNDTYQRRIKKYNPLFPDEFYGPGFNLPNMIVIVDDAVRRNIDVCKGAIGWLSDEKGMEVLHLYDEEVEKCGISFIPAPVCDAVYYVDRFNRNRFIQTDCIFGKAQEERLAELKHIAYSLGAKKCSIEISEDCSVSEKSKKIIDGNMCLPFGKKSVGFDTEHSSAKSESISRRGTIEAVFEGSDEIKIPALKWFANDDTIKRLIEIRSESGNQIKSERLELEGSVSATMSQKTACAIDCAINKIGFGANIDMEGQAFHENHSKLIFNVEF